MSSASLARVAQNFTSVTSSSASSSACTRSCLGVRVMRYGCGLREDSPSYPSKDMGSLGSDRMSNAQSNREIASHSSRSATWMPGQMRRLRRRNESSVSGEISSGTFWPAKQHTPRRTPNGLGPLRWGDCSIQHTSVCLLGSAQV